MTRTVLFVYSFGLLLLTSGFDNRIVKQDENWLVGNERATIE